MGLKITFSRSGSDQEQTLQFDDSAARISLGRDPKANQIVFPATETIVGRSHCALRRELGRYRMVLNERNVTYIDGEPAIDDQELPPNALLQLGPGGPVVRVEIDDASSLPPTEEHGYTVGKTAMLKGAHKTASRAATGAWLALAGLLATAAIIAVAIRRQSDINEDFEVKIVSAERLDADQAELLASLNTSTKRMRQSAAPGAADFGEVLAEVAKSVYLVIKRDAEGFEETVATAWVVNNEDGVFASNAHVAEELETLPPGAELILRSSTAPRRDFVVERVAMHPGYRQFDQIWSEYQPVTRPHSTEYFDVSPPGLACDVALLHVGEVEGIGPALPLASDKELAELRAGTPIAFVGFPMEGIALGGAHPKEPAPTSQIAYVTACTDYFGSPDVPVEQRLLIQNSLPLTGGASGSPIVNEAGRVVGVVSAGNFLVATDSNVRVGSAALINYGQRIDLVRELLDETAEAAQQERQQTWLTDLERYFEPRETAITKIDEAQLRVNWTEMLELDGDYEVETEAVESSPADGAAEGEGEAGAHFAVEDAQFLLVTAVKADAADADPPVTVGIGDEEPLRVSWQGDAGALLRYALLEPQGRPAEIVVAPVAGAAAESEIRAVVGNRRLRSLDDRLQAGVDRLAEAVALDGAGAGTPVRLGDRQEVTLEEDPANRAGMTAISITPDRPGYYLFVVAGNNGEDVDLAVVQTTGKETLEPLRDDSYSSWAAVMVKLEEPAGLTLTGGIVAPEPGIGCTLDTYFVPLASGGS